MSRESYVFTVNNPIEDDQNPFNLIDVARYLVFQLEEGEQGTVHYQGYVYLKKKARMVALQKILRAHYEPARGTPKQNRKYCTKEPRLEGPYEEGELPKQGQRIDLETVAQDVVDGKPFSEIALTYRSTWIRYNRGLKSLRATISTEERTWKTIVHYYYGISGAGKSYAASQESKEYGGDVYLKEPGNKWFDGYYGQKLVVFDEFRANWFPLSTLLRILDAYPLRVEVKGETSVNFLATHIWITSNMAPDQLYVSATGHELQALLRRLDFIQHFDTVFIPPPIQSPLLDSPPLD
nr:MAG: replication associated protein [Cressdnaviricota sp.]